jgi:hypothetical protein
VTQESVYSTVSQESVYSTTSGTVDKNSSYSHTGTIVGSVFGAAVLVILAVGLMFWLRGRKKQIPVISSCKRVFPKPFCCTRPKLWLSLVPPNLRSPPSDTLPRTKQETASIGVSQALHQPFIPQSLYEYHPYDPPLAPPPAYSSGVAPPLNPVFRGSLK